MKDEIRCKTLTSWQEHIPQYAPSHLQQHRRVGARRGRGRSSTSSDNSLAGRGGCSVAYSAGLQAGGHTYTVHKLILITVDHQLEYQVPVKTHSCTSDVHGCNLVGRILGGDGRVNRDGWMMTLEPERGPNF